MLYLYRLFHQPLTNVIQVIDHKEDELNSRYNVYENPMNEVIIIKFNLYLKLLNAGVVVE